MVWGAGEHGCLAGQHPKLAWSLTLRTCSCPCLLRFILHVRGECSCQLSIMLCNVCSAAHAALAWPSTLRPVGHRARRRPLGSSGCGCRLSALLSEQRTLSGPGEAAVHGPCCTRELLLIHPWAEPPLVHAPCTAGARSLTQAGSPCRLLASLARRPMTLSPSQWMRTSSQGEAIRATWPHGGHSWCVGSMACERKKERVRHGRGLRGPAGY